MEKSGLEGDDAFFGDDGIKADVCFLDRYFGNFLAGIGKADFFQMRVCGKEPVVVSGPVSDAVSCPVKAEKRKQDGLDFRRFYRELMRQGFRNGKLRSGRLDRRLCGPVWKIYGCGDRVAGQ